MSIQEFLWVSSAPFGDSLLCWWLVAVILHHATVVMHSVIGQLLHLGRA